MNWILALTIAVVSDALRIFLDNYISDVYFKERGAVSQKIVSGIAAPILGLIIVSFIGLDFSSVPPETIILLLLSGIFSSIAGIPYYRALELDDSTNLGIFFQFSPVMYLMIGWGIGAEEFSFIKLISCFVIITAPLLIILTSRKRSRKVRIKAASLAFLSIVFYVASGETFILGNSESLNIFSEIGLVLIVKGLSDLIFIGSQHKYRHRLSKIIKSTHSKVLIPINISIILRLVQEYSYRIGLILAPTVAIASAASDAVEPIVIFFMGLVLTLIWPKFGREKLQKRVVLVHLIATVLIFIGIALMRL